MSAGAKPDAATKEVLTDEDIEDWRRGLDDEYYDDDQFVEGEETRTAARRRRADSNSKWIHFSFVGYSKAWQAGKFGKLPDDAKLLMCVGQVNRPSYDCFKTPEARAAWLLTMLNKGKPQTGRLKPEDLTKLIEECIAEGYLSVNGKGPELTPDGTAHLQTFKNSRHKSSAQQPA